MWHLRDAKTLPASGRIGLCSSFARASWLSNALSRHYMSWHACTPVRAQPPMQTLTSHYSDAQLKRLINFILHYIADLDIPVKRGTFVEFRTGMLNVSPIGTCYWLLI